MATPVRKQVPIHRENSLNLFKKEYSASSADLKMFDDEYC